ncbi:MAG: tRNA pseudouridine synthase A [Ignavibacteriales bacterium]
MRYKLTIEYKGTRYQGWQVQKNVKTVQGTLFEALRQLFPKDKIDMQGSGRTDAGVHALAQIAHLELQRGPDMRNFIYRVNDLLPADIVLRAAEPVSPKFHARYSAIARSYIYQISSRPSGFYKDYVWWVKDSLNYEKMGEALAFLKGRNDFFAFSQVDNEGEDSKAEVLDIQVGKFGELILIRLKADHFLWKMVRRIIGAAVEVGRGNAGVTFLKDAMINKDARIIAPYTAPPSGLFLEKVYYSEDMNEPEFKPLFQIE